MTGTVRTRFGPSPTGYLHIGSLRTALFNWLFARHAGGKFILRIEDTDTARSRPEFELRITEDLDWLGLDRDEGPGPTGANGKGPYRQSQRLGIYREYAEKLVERNMAYRCYCSLERLEELKAEQLKAGTPPRYNGACRGIEEPTEGISPVIRFMVPGNRTVRFRDLVHAEMRFDTKAFGDFVIIDSSGTASYNFAAAIDDSLMSITHVIRGDDHLPNTPRQILILDALALEIPAFAHLPLVLGPGKTPLGKRDSNLTLRALKDGGFLPAAVLNATARLGWSPGEKFMTLKEMADAFSLERVSKSPSVFDLGRLKFYNKTAMARLSTEEIIGLAPAASKRTDPTMLKEAVEAARPNAATLKDFDRLLAPFTPASELTDAAAALLNEEHARTVLEVFMDAVEQASILDEQTYGEIITKVKAATGEKGKKLFMPIRCALTGDTEGIELVKVVRILGREKVVERLRTALRAGPSSSSGKS